MSSSLPAFKDKNWSQEAVHSWVLEYTNWSTKVCFTEFWANCSSQIC